MSENIRTLDIDDMPEITDFSKGRKNPFAKQIKEKGYTVRITEHFSPEQIANGNIDDTKDILRALIEPMSANDIKRLIAYIKDNFDSPCTPEAWEAIEEGLKMV